MMERTINIKLGYIFGLMIPDVYKDISDWILSGQALRNFINFSTNDTVSALKTWIIILRENRCENVRP